MENKIVTRSDLDCRFAEIKKLLDETLELMKGATIYDSSEEVKCPFCSRPITEPDDIAFVKEYGICISCDSEKYDIDRRNYDEVNKEEE